MVLWSKNTDMCLLVCVGEVLVCIMSRHILPVYPTSTVQPFGLDISVTNWLRERDIDEYTLDIYLKQTIY